MEKKRNTVKKVLKWMVIALTFLSFLLILTAFLLAKFYGEGIKTLFITELNKRLRSEVFAEEVRFSFLKQFPYATLEFSGLSALDATENKKRDTLLKAGSLQLHFNLMSLYHKRYIIRRIDLKDARVRLRVYKDLSDNFHFWKTDTSVTGGDFAFALEKVVFSKVGLRYRNDASGQDYSVFFSAASGKGRFSDERYSLRLAGDVLLRQVRSGTAVLFRDKEAGFSLVMEADQRTGLYSINRGDVTFGKLKLKATGHIVYDERKKHLDLRLVSKEALLKDWIAGLPGDYGRWAEDYLPEGSLVLQIGISGPFGGDLLPRVLASFSLKEGRITDKNSGVSIEDLAFSGTYDNHASGDPERQEILFNTLSGKLMDGSFSGRLSMRGLKPSSLLLTLKAEAALPALAGFLPPGRITKTAGRFETSLSFSGLVGDPSAIRPEEFLRGKFSGDLRIKDLSFGVKDHDLVYDGFSGDLTFNNNDVLVRKLEGKIAGNVFSAEGYFRNLIPHLMSSKEALQVKASIVSDAIDLGTLLAGGPGPENGEYALVFPDGWTGDVKLQVDKLVFNSFRADKLNCLMSYSGKKLLIGQLSFRTAGGTFSGEGLISGKGKQIGVSVDATLQSVDLPQLFREFGNFGQDYLVADNLKGISRAEVQTAFSMTPSLVIDPASIVSMVDITVEQGELINFSPISGLGKFIRVDDLSRVRFSTLKNTIHIKDKVITIPSMDVVSDALNFSMSGTHTFSHEINYRFQVLLSHILSKKARQAKKENEEFGIELDEQPGRTTLYILLTGTVDDPRFRYDSKGVKGKIVTSFLNEKISFRQTIRNEFSRNKEEKDSVEARQDHIMQQQEAGKFVIDWENSLGDSLSVNKKEEPKEKKKVKKADDRQKFRVEWEDEPE